MLAKSYFLKYKSDGFEIKNIEKPNKVVIAFCTSDLYSPYCAVAIQSIIDNSSSKNYYEIFILEYDVSSENKRKIINLIKNASNFSIYFLNMQEGLKDIKINTWAHFSPVACLKLFLFSDAFVKYNKILVLDTDLVFCRDAADLYNLDITNNSMAAVDDFIMKTHVINKKFTSGFAPKMPIDIYLKEYLNFGKADKYFNTGVVLLNLNLCRNENIFRRSIIKLQMKGYVYQEQDVINELLYKKAILLNHKWNVIGTDQENQIKNTLSEKDKNLFIDSVENPWIIHFAGGLKPWNAVETPYSEIFYKFAKKTPYYEKILMNIVNNKLSYFNKNISDTVYVNTSLRVKLKAFLKRLFPTTTTRGQIIRKLFPRGRGIRGIYFKIYSYLFIDNINEKKKIEKETNLLCKRNGIYHNELKKKILANVVLLDSKNGTDIAGNIFRIISELSKDEYKLDIYLAYVHTAKDRIERILKRYSLSKIHLVEFKSLEYFRLLARAKYLVTDLYFISEFVKRKEQVLLSTAHGTPIKVMGKDCHTETQGHLQRTHTIADYQTFPSFYMKDKLFHAFMEDNLFKGQALKSGYCRNDIFFDIQRKNMVRKELGFVGKKVFAYLPTFRGIAGNFESKKQLLDIEKFCDELDLLMKNDEILLVKFHNFVNEKMNFEKYNHIKEFPDDYEVYDVLNATDGLISDYSSVFFDYANTRQKIILFQYDFDEYINERGIYLNWNDLPFPVVDNVKSLYHEMITPKEYDDKKFLETYCTFDSLNSTEKVCKQIFLGKNECKVFESTKNNKKNIFIYAGNFDLRNDSTYLCIEYLKRMSNKNNYFLYFYEYDLFNRAYILKNLPNTVNYFSFLSYPDLNKAEQKCVKKSQIKKLDEMFLRECKKCFADLPIDVYIDLSGKNFYVAEIAKNLQCKKIIVDTEIHNLSKACLDSYDIKLRYIDKIELKQTSPKNGVVYLTKGYQREDIEKNLQILERLCE